MRTAAAAAVVQQSQSEQWRPHLTAVLTPLLLGERSYSLQVTITKLLAATTWYRAKGAVHRYSYDTYTRYACISVLYQRLTASIIHVTYCCILALGVSTADATVFRCEGTGAGGVIRQQTSVAQAQATDWQRPKWAGAQARFLTPGQRGLDFKKKKLQNSLASWCRSLVPAGM